jgi:hypothetical protein
MASSRGKHEAASSSRGQHEASSRSKHEADSLELMEAVEEWLGCSDTKPDYAVVRASLSAMPLPKALPKRKSGSALLVVKAGASMPGFPAPKWTARGARMQRSLERHKLLHSGVTLTDDEYFDKLVGSDDENLADAATLVEDAAQLNERLLQRVLNKELERMGGTSSADKEVAWPKAQDVATLWEDTEDDEPAAQDERVADIDPYECVACDDAQAHDMDAEDQPEEDDPDEDDRKMCDLIARDMDAEDEPEEAGPEDDERPPCELPAQDMDAEDELEFVEVEELEELPQAQDKRAEDEPILKHFKTIKQTF